METKIEETDDILKCGTCGREGVDEMTHCLACEKHHSPERNCGWKKLTRN